MVWVRRLDVDLNVVVEKRGSTLTASSRPLLLELQDKFDKDFCLALGHLTSQMLACIMLDTSQLWRYVLEERYSVVEVFG